MDVNCKKPVIVLTGPTAVGKTDLSIKLASLIDGEIVSADSMQVYKCMDIGTAKIKPSEMNGIKHHLIDVLSPDEEFNVMIFKEMALSCIDNIHDRGKIPIITGGTGYYIQAVLKNVSFTDYDPATEKEVFAILDDIERTDGPEGLYKRLISLDKDYADTLHQNNVKRVYKALAHIMITGEKYSELNSREAIKESPFNYAYFVLTMDRKTLYDRIDKRVDIMLDEGLVDEVKKLLDLGMTKNMVSMQGLGYKEVIDYLNGDCTYDEMVYTLKQRTRHFAKRQMTWFRREKDVIFLDKNEHDEDELLKVISDVLSDKGIIQ